MGKSKITFVDNQKGMVSIIVTMVLIIIMTLVVLAMSQNSNREQRQALDRQLSDQAFYNAESGISDWAQYIYDNSDSLPPEKPSCDTPAANYPNAPTPDIGTDGVNSYTCILYDKAPLTLEYDTVTVSDSIVTPIEPYGMPGNSRLRTLVFEWRAKDGGTNTSGCTLSATSSLPQQLPGTCSIGGLRIDVVNPSGFNRNQIINNNFPAYILPGNGGGSLNYSANGPLQDQGQIGRANCNGGICRLELDGINLANGERRYLHIKGLYKTSNLTISACRVPAANCGNGNQDVRFNSSQIEIDSTGKSNDVLRRVKVRLPVESQFENAGSFSLKTTQSICKLIEVAESSSGGNTATMDTRCQ